MTLKGGTSPSGKDQSSVYDNISLRYIVPESAVAVPAVVADELVYTGENVALAFSTSLENIVIDGVTNATTAGTYSFDATPASGYMWPDTTTAKKSFTWKVLAAENTWTTPPAISSTSFSSTQSAGVTITVGIAKFGLAVATISKDGGAAVTFDGTVPTAEGVYDLTYSVPASDNWLALVTTVSFRVTPFDISLGSNAFYNLLETNASRVASSPYATGGDYVLKLGPTEYAHVFKSGLSSFTPSQDLNGKVLLIGGGGAGGGNNNWIDGGGGAGGFVETNGVAFAKGASHYVSVGKGGSGTNGGNGGDGKNSFVEFPGLVEGQVEYAQATGNVCFDTGVKPTYDSTIDMKFELDTFDGNASIFCARRHYESPRNSYTLFAMKNDAYWSFHYVDDNTASSTAPAIETGVPYEVHAAGGGLWINSTQVGQYTLASGSPANNLTLFYSYSGSTTQGAGNYLKGKIYYCRVTNGTTVLLDLVPCVQNNVAGFYDRISRTFKKPSSGTLTAGPVVSGKTVEQIVAYGGGGGGGKSNSGSNGASGGGGANSSTAVGGTALYGDQGHAGGVGSGYGGGGGGGAGAVGGDPVGTTSSDPKSHAGDGGDGKASDILGFEQYFAGGGGGCCGGSQKRHGYGGKGGGHGGGTDAKGSLGEEMYAGTDGLGGGGGANGNPSNQGCSGRGGKGLVVIRYSVSASGAPSLGTVKLTNAGGSALTMAGTVANSGTSEAKVMIKLWPTAGTEDGEGTVTNEVVVVPANKVYAAFEELVSGLSFDTDYTYTCWVENTSGASAAQTGTISTYSKTVVPTAVLTEGGAEVVATTNGFNWIYTFEKNGSFMIPEGKIALAKLLVVGGGGAGGGWGGGGGGAGGVKYYPTYVLTPGTYPIIVGKGGTHATGNGGANSGGHGGASSFGELSVSGGGTGANPYYASNNAGTSEATQKGGSSAGGLGNDSYSYAGIDGEGHSGGNGKKTNNTTQVNGAKGYSGGGGGAGTAGQDATTEKGGDGGDGYACAITGETKYYGAGGGGSFYCMDTGSAGLGGLGGGGNGGSYDEGGSKNGTAGTFYGAGGGAGALNTSKANAYGGDGYQGVVIVVLTDYAQAGGSPILEVNNFTDITESSAKVAVNVPSAGAGATVKITAYWGYEEGDYTVGSQVLATKMIGEASYTLDGLSPNRTYYVKIVADNGSGEEDATAEAETSFTTAAGLNDVLGAYSNTQASYTFNYTVSALGDGVNTGLLYVATSIAGLDSVEPVDAWELTESGVNLGTAFVFNPQTLGYEFGRTYYYRIAVVNYYGDGLASTNTTGYSQFILSDNATYTWKGETGYWNDPEMWTSSVAESVENGYSLGYPVYGSYARFANNMTTTVLVARAERCVNVNYEYTGLDLTIRGTAEGATIRPDDAAPGAGGSTFLGANSTYLFDNVEIFLPNWGCGSFPNGVSATFVNGAKATANRLGSSWEYVLMQNSGATLSLNSGSKFMSGSLSAADGNAIKLDGGVYEVNTSVAFDLASISGRGAAALSFGAVGSRVTTYDFKSSYADASIDFLFPKAGYAVPALYGSNKMAASGGTITLNAVKKGAPICKGSKNFDFRVARFENGINTNKVIFGKSVNAKSYFYFSGFENNLTKEIWFHYKGTGFAIIIR